MSVSAIIAMIAIVSLMIFFTALYVAAEFATVYARKTRIQQMAASGHSLAKMLMPIVEDEKALDHYVAACQHGITISSLVLGAYGQDTVAAAIRPLLVQLGNLPEPAAQSVSITGTLILLTILAMVLAELFPKSLGLQYPEKMALATIIPMRWSMVLMRPLIWFFNGSGNLVLRLLGHHPGGLHTHAHAPEEIELLVAESHRGGLLEPQEQQMLRNALRLRELTARQVMTPRIRMVAAPIEARIAELITLCSDTGLTRIPLYRETIDNIIGFVHLKDLFRLSLQGQDDPAEILREVIHVPETLPIDAIWSNLRQMREYVAVVLDEYGGTAGLLTFEDLIEEVIGEVQDEFDDELAMVASDKAGRLRLRGDLLVTDVNEYLDLHLTEGEADTLGGLVLSKLGHVPTVGEEVTIGVPGMTIRVEAMEGLSVSEVSLQLPAGASPDYTEWETSRSE